MTSISTITSTINKPDDLSNAVSTLSDSITQAMRYLYEVQTAAINAGKIRNQAEKFMSIKRALKDQWEAVASVLKRCYSFGGDVDILMGVIGKTNKKDVIDFLRKMYGQGQETQQVATQLANGHRGVVETYYAHKDEILNQLKRYPRRGNSDPGAGRLSIGRHTLRSSDLVLVDKTAGTPPGARSRASPTASPQSDGLESMNSFESTMESIRHELFNLSNSLAYEVSFCDRCLKGAEDPKLMPSMEELKRYASDWKGRRLELMQGVSDIYLACDALLVDTKGGAGAGSSTVFRHQKSASPKPMKAYESASKERKDPRAGRKERSKSEDDVPSGLFCLQLFFSKHKKP